MPKYKYKVVSKAGETVKSTVEAKNKEEVLEMLRGKEFYILNLEEEKSSTNIILKRKVKIKDIAVMCRQIYTMLNSGLNILGCLEVIRDECSNKALKNAFYDIYEDVQKGVMFSQALENHKDVIPDLLINMVNAGETSGNLDTVMRRMAEHYEKDAKINNKIKTAMIYPIVLIVVSIAVVIFILTFVMPTFMEIFSDTGQALPLPTRMLLGMSNSIKYHWYIHLAVILTIIFTIAILNKTPQFKVKRDGMKLKAPLMGKIAQGALVSRFTRTLSTLLSSGMGVVDALEIVSRVVSNNVVETKIIEVKNEVIKGSGIYEPIKNTGVFPKMLCSMIRIGEESGTLDEILNKTADFYDNELDDTIQRAISLMEPILIVVLAIIVGFIIISIVIPMFDMYNNI